ncbi:MAG: AAA family ATPase [Verrucomicrobiae bacterium]|nr:AAA family ATPase [Verrucomicrobiae bacterium]
MSILQEILTWSEALPAWESDAIARLFATGTLSDKDLDDLFALLKAEHGIADPQNRTANKLSADQIPAVSALGTEVKLVALKNFRHVNRLAENQRLPLAANGLSVIYGDNGSGKSGYSRVLKRACRARDQSEPIHPNAFLPTDQVGNPEAMFEVEVNGVKEDVGWVNGKAGEAKLSSLSVFDSRCARSYLDDEGDYAYVPYGLDILEGLANACKRLKGKIEGEHANSVADTTAFADLIGNTVVGRLIEKLSYTTKPEHVAALAMMKTDEEARHNELKKSLDEGNPKEKAAQLKLRASRISKLAQRITRSSAIVDDTAVEKLRGLVDAFHTAQAAATLAAQKFKEDASLLPGTGGDAWKELFTAARKFSVTAYPEKTFPELGSGAQCPLCQQPLKEGADRLRLFENFVQEEAEKTAQARKDALTKEHDSFVKQNVSLGMDDELKAEVEALDMVLSSDTQAFEKALSSRHAAIKLALASREWDKVEKLPPGSASRLQLLADRLNQEAETLDKMTDEKARAALKAEFDELAARMRLAKLKAAVLTAIERLGHQAKLSGCLSAVKTNAISLKASDLTEKVVSKELEVALNQEFKSLGVGNLQVCLKSRADRGKAFHKLKLNLPQAKTPGEILSEGEQRAIAIGSFLAEVNIAGSLGGIVFDDPVSSLDHKRRERVARRLVQEAAKRQVIIFTHDLYFLNLLIEESEKLAVPIATQSVTRRPDGFGVAIQDLPFEGMSTKARVGYLRNRQQEIQKIYKSGDELEHRKQTADAYRQLRIAWERAIEEILFRQVVLRFRKGIETQRLAGVLVEDADYATIDSWMSKCSNYAHDQALLGGVEVPSPDDLLVDINALDVWRKKTEERGVDLAKKRKSGK